MKVKHSIEIPVEDGMDGLALSEVLSRYSSATLTFNLETYWAGYGQGETQHQKVKSITASWED